MIGMADEIRRHVRDAASISIGIPKHSHYGRRARNDGIIMGRHKLCDPLPGSNSWTMAHPGYSSLLLLDPGLISPIPTGMKNLCAGLQLLRH